MLVLVGFALRTAEQLPLTSIATVLQWPRGVGAGACFGVVIQRNARAAFARSWLATAPLPPLGLAHGVRLNARRRVARGAGRRLAYLLLFNRTEVEVGPMLELQAQVSQFFLAAAVLGNLASARHDAPPRRKPRPQTVHRQRVSIADLRPLLFWLFAVWRENLRGSYLDMAAAANSVAGAARQSAAHRAARLGMLAWRAGSDCTAAYAGRRDCERLKYRPAMPARTVAAASAAGGRCAAAGVVRATGAIVLNESFNGPDPASALVLKRHLRARVDSGRCRVVLATRALDIVARYADRAALLSAGRPLRGWNADDLARLRATPGDDLDAELALAMQAGA